MTQAHSSGLRRQVLLSTGMRHAERTISPALLHTERGLVNALSSVVGHPGGYIPCYCKRKLRVSHTPYISALQPRDRVRDRLAISHAD